MMQLTRLGSSRRFLVFISAIMNRRLSGRWSEARRIGLWHRPT